MNTLPLGQVVVTANASGKLTSEEINAAIAKHSTLDWGDVCHEDQALNDAGLRDGGRIHSVYKAANGEKFWMTTVLMPEDY